MSSAWRMSSLNSISSLQNSGGNETAENFSLEKTHVSKEARHSSYLGIGYSFLHAMVIRDLWPRMVRSVRMIRYAPSNNPTVDGTRNRTRTTQAPPKFCTEYRAKYVD